jgi:hypothetical protein
MKMVVDNTEEIIAVSLLKKLIQSAKRGAIIEY